MSLRASFPPKMYKLDDCVLYNNQCLRGKMKLLFTFSEMVDNNVHGRKLLIEYEYILYKYKYIYFLCADVDVTYSSNIMGKITC